MHKFAWTAPATLEGGVRIVDTRIELLEGTLAERMFDAETPEGSV